MPRTTQDRHKGFLVLAGLGRGQSFTPPGCYGCDDGTGRAPEASFCRFSDVSLDADTGRKGNVARGQGDKVRLSWLPHDGGVNGQTRGWSRGGVDPPSRRVMNS